MADYFTTYFHKVVRMRRLIGLLCIILLTGCATLPKALPPTDVPQTCKNEHEIYSVSHGWHAGLVVQAQDLNAAVPELADRFPTSRFYEIGWGDSGFYQSSEITTGLTLQAMFWSTGSVLHVVGFDKAPRKMFSHSEVVELHSDATNYRNLIDYVSSSFARDENGRIIMEKRGIYGDGQFYTGVGRYHILNTCNKWTAKALSSAGYDISPVFSLRSSSVMSSARDMCPEETQQVLRAD